MHDDIITLKIDGGTKEYRLLFVIEDEYKYIIYSDKENANKLYVIKTKELNKNEKSLPISDEEWKMIESKYNNLIIK